MHIALVDDVTLWDVFPLYSGDVGMPHIHVHKFIYVCFSLHIMECIYQHLTKRIILLSTSLQANFCVELFGGGELEYRVMQKAGCLNYSLTPWELDKDGIYVRQICYKFDKCVSRYRGEAVSTQQRSLLPDRNGWVIEEVLTLHGVPLGDHFNV